MQPDADAVVLNYATLAEPDAIGRDPQSVVGLIAGFVADTHSLMIQVEQATKEGDVAR